MGKKELYPAHVTVSMPRDLIEQIKKDIEKGILKGYRNHHQFCQEAVRLRYQQLTSKDIDYSEMIEILKKIK